MVIKSQLIPLYLNTPNTPLHHEYFYKLSKSIKNQHMEIHCKRVPLSNRFMEVDKVINYTINRHQSRSINQECAHYIWKQKKKSNQSIKDKILIKTITRFVKNTFFSKWIILDLLCHLHTFLSSDQCVINLLLTNHIYLDITILEATFWICTNSLDKIYKKY